MGDLGQRLKQEREARGVSLDEIAQKTRIGVRMLKAIEEEAFDQLPGGIFNKSFIQQYAHYLEVDEKQVVRDYLRATAATRETQFPQPAPPPRQSIYSTSRLMLRLSLGAIAIVLIALIAGLIVPRSDSPKVSQTATLNAPAVQSSGPAAPVTDDEASSVPDSAESPASRIEAAAEVETAQGASEPDRASVFPRPQGSPPPPSPAELLTNAGEREPLAGELPEELLLQITARSTVWISITADGEKEWQGTMQANQSREVQATEAIRLTVGNAGGVVLTLNGKELGSLGSEGEVKTVTLASRALRKVIP